MTIGERLLMLRKERNLSQEELANELKVSRQSISKWETNQSMPDFDKVIALCDYFGITTDELLTGNRDIVEAKENNNKTNYARNLAIAVGLYIISAVAVILFSAEFNKPIIGVCIAIALIAVATGLIIFNSIVYGKKVKKVKNENSQMKLIIEVVDIIGLVLYFLISFLTRAWYITWIVFLIIPAVDTIIKLLFSLKEDKLEEEKTDEQDN